MRRLRRSSVLFCAVLLLAACGPDAQPAPAASIPEPTETITTETIATTPGSAPTARPTRVPFAEPTISQSEQPLPLSASGPYETAISEEVVFVDGDRDGREVGVILWYPTRGGEPDASGAPYPLLLASSKNGGIFGAHLASYGFVVAGITGIDTYAPWDRNLIDQPLDILFALDSLAGAPPEDLAGLFDADRAGTFGYSFDGYNAVAVSGARIDPTGYLTRCAEATPEATGISQSLIDYYCEPAQDWGLFESIAGERVTTSGDDLWQPMTDARIRAVMPMAPDGAWLFGERGLAAIDRSMLIVGATRDTAYFDGAYIYEHAGTPDKLLLTFVDQGHMMIYDPAQSARMRHFAVAFFGYHLQGRSEYAGYLAAEGIAEVAGLAWGVVTDD